MASPSSPTSVLFTRPTLGQGGADRVTLTLLRHLPRDRFSTSLALLRHQGELADAIPSDVPVHSLDVARLTESRRPLAALLRALQPTVLFSTSGGTNPVAVLAARRAGYAGRVVLSERNGLLRDQPPHKKWALLALKAWTYRRADLVTAVSDGVRDDLVRRLHLPRDRTRTVWNPVITPDFDARAAAPLPVRDRENGPLVVAAGRLEAAKDFGTLFEAIARVRQRVPARLILLGEGTRRAELEALRSSLGLESAVEMPGYDLNPLPWFAAADVFALSSRYEGLPGVLIQAMACGTATVATDCPFGPSEVIDPGVTGMLAPVGEPEPLAGEILALLEDPRRRERIATAGRDSVQRFRLTRILPLYESALLEGSEPR